MKTIWKWVLSLETTIIMPRDSVVLCVQEQFGDICLWALVDPDARPPERRTFKVYGTGQYIAGEIGKYIGTVQLESGRLVFHVFETGS